MARHEIYTMHAMHAIHEIHEIHAMHGNTCTTRIITDTNTKAPKTKPLPVLLLKLKKKI